jgi:hypothetical protein
MERWRATPLAVDHAGAPLRRRHAAQHGSSLVELLTSILFVSILMAMSYTFARAALMTTRVQEAKSEAQVATVMALDVMTRELRLAGFSATARPLVAIPAAGPEQIAVAADFNGDGNSDDSNELIAYTYDAAKQQLMRATGGSPQPFVRNVPPGGARFCFFDAAGDELPAGTLTSADRRRIHRIDIALDVELPNPDPLSGTPLVSRVSSSVSLRNQ